MQHKAIAAFLDRRTEWMLRVAFAIVIGWFGALKIAHMSPAEELVDATLAWTQIPNVSYFLGMWEVIIGLCFLAPRLTRFTLAMFIVHMAGTLSPLFMLPEHTYNSMPFGLSFAGQYIIKNLVFLAAGAALYVRYEQRRR
jgi:uncharacterized membrane protein YkgB